ncbi:MAG: hypothetical protein ACI4NJ_05680 [Cellvibrio sp.]
MKISIYVIGTLFFCSWAKATSPGCWTDEKVLKKNSKENRAAFNISITKSFDGDEVSVNFSAPKKIDGIKFKAVSAYGINSEDKLIYLFPVKLTSKNNRFISGYAISNDLIGNSYIEFSYAECKMVFTYRLDQIASELNNQ